MKTQRLALQQRLFPRGIPKLWCPTLTHFAAAHTLDAVAIGEHLTQLAPLVHGILVPGSTGEGWEMSNGEVRELLELVVPLAAQLNIDVLIGILKTDTQAVLAAMEELADLLRAPSVVGVTVCPAQGADKSQRELYQGLDAILSRNIPTAVYQLPQVTQNELDPQTVLQLAQQHSNFILFKDTSGEDRVANSGLDFEGVFMVRGSERDGYAHWLRSAGGNYDGFLLSTANVFAAELTEIIRRCDAGDCMGARTLSQEVSGKVASAFEIVASFGTGNPFTNANKAIYHIRQHGANWRTASLPLLISGKALPLQLIEEVSRRQ